jgi:hypothetical protein
LLQGFQIPCVHHGPSIIRPPISSIVLLVILCLDKSTEFIYKKESVAQARGVFSSFLIVSFLLIGGFRF